jgi:hypothetical protein
MVIFSRKKHPSPPGVQKQTWNPVSSGGSRPLSLFFLTLSFYFYLLFYLLSFFLSFLLFLFFCLVGVFLFIGVFF